MSLVLADFDDPKIPELVDLIFASNTYHHIEGRVAYFERAARYLRPSWRIAVLDYRRQGLFHLIMGHATDSSVIRSGWRASGWGVGVRPPMGGPRTGSPSSRIDSSVTVRN